MRKPLITLTSDFGAADHFTGVMKGVILSLAPQAVLVDITHDIRPFDIADGAFTVAETYPYFPPGTIHVVVVDPGVGSARRPVLIEAARQFFIGPDNGVFSLLLSREKHKVRHITNEKLFHHPVSRTFHGRDIFAPSAAHLAAGVPPSRLGPLVHDPWTVSSFDPIQTGKRFWNGVILKIDRFGNLITNLHIDRFPSVLTRPFELLAGLERLDRLVANFSEAPAGQPVVLVGSSGFLEVAINQASAAAHLKVAPGSPVELTLY